ncbi:unnamed product [Ostreococcus tauri]|uniref:Unnamed product n=1 Tax=Ostreococcus tauri TaxID=70448 RepID=Q01A30_OSTTA|nr:unnamed product [Ostreococcus tauri]CAL51969.1 unnamed product [Ostreococcus tauri]|eukprot:XP_003079088.1 unnamed product [Ostreococcus tauri]
MLSRSDPSWRAVIPGRENDEDDDFARTSTSEEDDEYVTDIEEGDGERRLRAGDASASDEDEDDGAFQDARDTLGPGVTGREAAITTGLLEKSSPKLASSRSGWSRTWENSSRGRRKRSSKSSKDELRRKAERRAYKPVTFTLLLRLCGLYTAFGVLVLCYVIMTSLGPFLNPTGEVLELNVLENVVWMIISVATFLAIPSCLAHITGYLTWPPVWLEAFPDRAKILEELGGKIYFRFHVSREAKPLAVKRAVDVAIEILQRSIPTTLFVVEVVSYKEIGISGAAVNELIVPLEMNDRFQGNTGLLSYATRASSASWGDWVVHMGSDALLNVRAVDAVLAHCARETRLAALSGRGDTHVRRLAQGAVLPGITRTSNSLIDGVESAFQWIPAMAECIRAGESYGALRMMYAKYSRVVAPIPNTYLVVPNELELAVGFGDMEVHDGFELTSFALMCSNNGVKFAWLDAGVHVPIISNVWKLFKARARDHHSALVLMRDENALDHVHRASLSFACLSAGFSTIAPVITAFAPWCLRRSGPDTFAISCIVGFITACVTFKYAIGFYKSASISDLSQGVVSGAIYYNVLFVLTIVLTPVFSVFEFIALCTSIFYSPEHFGAESKKIRRPTVSILKTDDDEDFDWLERGDRSKFQEKEVLLPPEAGAKRWSRRTASQRSSSR